MAKLSKKDRRDCYNSRTIRYADEDRWGNSVIEDELSNLEYADGEHKKNEGAVKQNACRDLWTRALGSLSSTDAQNGFANILQKFDPPRAFCRTLKSKNALIIKAF